MLLHSLLLAAAATSAVPLELHVIVMSGESIDGMLRADSRDACRLDFKHDPANVMRLGCRLDLAPGTRIDFEGESWTTLDFGPVTSPFAESGDFGERFERYAAALDAFGRKHAADGWYGNPIERAEPVSAADLDEAEQRIGQPLPAEFRQLLQRMGAASVDDHAFSGEDLRSTYDHMISDWGTPAESMRADLGAATETLFRATTILFTEVGDGLGGLLYRASDHACAGGAAYWYVHQDSINEPELLRTTAGGCANFAQSVHWLLDEFVTDQVQDNLPERTLLIDPLSAGSRLQMSLDPISIQVRRAGPHGGGHGAGATGAF
jgi:hypothetical protein